MGIEHRGRDATGFGYVCDNEEARVQKASLPASQFIKQRARIPGDARTVLLHTRLATNGSPAFPENNHPTTAGSIMSVHNGVIYNDWELFSDIDYIRRGGVDSEVVPALVHTHGLDNHDKWIDDVEGSFALAYLDVARPGELYLVRGSHSPLFVYQTSKMVVWASTKETIRKAWSKCFGTPPDAKNIEDIAEGTVLYFDTRARGESHDFTPKSNMYPSYGVRTYSGSCLVTPPKDPITMTDEEYSDWWNRCGVCDSYFGDDDLEYHESMFVCEDCRRALGIEDADVHYLDTIEHVAETLTADEFQRNEVNRAAVKLLSAGK